jgi:hypothetical protein
MLWMLVVLITTNNVIGQNIDSVPNTDPPEVLEGSTTTDGRLILLINREDLDLATVLIESEARCRKELANRASSPPLPPAFPWGWVAGAALVFFLGGLAAGHFM